MSFALATPIIYGQVSWKYTADSYHAEKFGYRIR